MSNQVGQLLPPEDLEEALAHLARLPQVGGWKRLASLLNHKLADDPTEAGKWLHRALDPTRRESFKKKHFDRALDIDKQVGCYILWDWHCRDRGYKTSDPLDAKSHRLMLMEEDERHARRRREIQAELDEMDAGKNVADLRGLHVEDS